MPIRACWGVDDIWLWLRSCIQQKVEGERKYRNISVIHAPPQNLTTFQAAALPAKCVIKRAVAGTAAWRIVLQVRDLSDPAFVAALGLPSVSHPFISQTKRSMWYGCGVNPPCPGGPGECTCLITINAHTVAGHPAVTVMGTLHSAGLMGSELVAGEIVQF